MGPDRENNKNVYLGKGAQIMDRIPNDPFMLYSFVNMNLRDRFDSLEELCAAYDADIEAITEKLKAAGFEYDKERNQFG